MAAFVGARAFSPSVAFPIGCMQHFSSIPAQRLTHLLRFLRPVALLGLLLALLPARPLLAQPDRPLYVTDGSVFTIVRDGGTVYIGGSFTQVGPNDPYGTTLDVGTGVPDPRSAVPNGTVYVAVPDGAGGWYIGGDFTTVGGVARDRLAQLDASGAITAFNPNADNIVRALVLAGTTLYVSGGFTTIGGQNSSNLAAVSAATGMPLPVELTAFTATAEGTAAVRLAWATASEKNSRAFEVERSLDGRAFAPIGTVAAAGSSSTPRSYELLDPHPPIHQSALYYRLRQVDADGTFSYSPVRTVSLTHLLNYAFTLFPNPAHGAATLTGTLPGTVVTVTDALGRPVTSATADAAGTAALALPAGQPAGVYVVRAGTRAVRLAVE